MALQPINVLVKYTLPYLVDEVGTDAIIQQQLETLFYLMQQQTEKSDDDVLDESQYSNLQRIFFADYVAYELYRVELARLTAGKAGVAAELPRTIKRAKADVVETEFETLKGINQTPGEMLASLREEVCAKARMLHYQVPICLQAITAKMYPGAMRFIPGRATRAPGAANPNEEII